MNSRNLGLDALRVISILYIVGYWHLFNYTDAFPAYNNFVTLRIAKIFLGVFVLMSGYFSGLSLAKGNSKKQCWAFYQKRLVRIYPLFLAAIFTYLLLGLSTPGTLLKASMLLSMFLKPAPQTLWFVTLIMLLYAIAPFLINLARNKWSVVLFLLSSILILHTYGLVTERLDSRILIYLPIYFAGIYVAKTRLFLEEDKRQPNKYKVLLAVFVGSIAIEVVPSPLQPLAMTLMILSASLLLAEAFMLLNTEIRARPGIKKLLGFLSYSSFSLYLFHRPIFETLKVYYASLTGSQQVLVLMLVILPISILLSWLIQKLYDAVLEAVARRFSNMA